MTNNSSESSPPLLLDKASVPLFEDPVWQCPADPTVIWNPERREWMMYYTQRRGTLLPINGLDWAHGTAIGIATSRDGLVWDYRGICQGDDHLGEPLKAGFSWWAPAVFRRNGTYHFYVSCVSGGIHTNWDGLACIKHFTGTDGITWKLESELKLSSERCIDPCIAEIGGQFYMWYKDERHDNHIWFAVSPDLYSWEVCGEAIGDIRQEAPVVWEWKGSFWLITDAWSNGCRIYASANGIDNWTYHSTVLLEPGTRHMDNARGAHPFIQVDGERAYIFYFNHFRPADPIYELRRAVIQVAELKFNSQSVITCDRNFQAVGGGLVITK